MSSMDGATRNATSLLKKLNTQYNRARQAAITTELIEVSSPPSRFIYIEIYTYGGLLLINFFLSVSYSYSVMIFIYLYRLFLELLLFPIQNKMILFSLVILYSSAASLNVIIATTIPTTKK